MTRFLNDESDKLARSWGRHEAAWLRDYLVAGVEDPRINVQSILSRHFLVEAIGAGGFGTLMQQEHRFAAAMNWLISLTRPPCDATTFETVLYSLRRGADNAEGIEIPHFILEVFASLPATSEHVTIPNYIEALLSGTQVVEGQARLDDSSLSTFQNLWAAELGAELRKRVIVTLPGPSASKAEAERRLDRCSVLEPACGSANDYRFLSACGLAGFIEYAGFDLCEKNIANARALCPGARFDVGNVFDIAASDKAFDFCIVHDLFEHLSLDAMEVAVREVCRVTRRGLCVGFFNMDEIPDHEVRVVEEYHWNTLSMARMKELFAQLGFSAQVVHIGSFLRRQVGCDRTHNPNAYTFVLWS